MVFLLTVPFISYGQGQYFEAGKSYLGPSVGLSFLGSAFQFGANYEYGMKMEFGTIGIGGVFRYWGYTESVTGSVKWSNVLLGAQGNYHFKMEPASKLDPWVGLILGYDAQSWSWSKPANYNGPDWSTSSGGLILNAEGGARYWFSPTVAVRASVGFGSFSYGALDVGLDFKL
jgi:hypothetical protein